MFRKTHYWNTWRSEPFARDRRVEDSFGVRALVRRASSAARLCRCSMEPNLGQFFGEAGARERGAVLYTVIESCRRQRIGPHACLKDVLTRLSLMTNRQLVAPYRKTGDKCTHSPLKPLHKSHTRQTMAPMRGGASGDAYGMSGFSA